MNEEEAIENLKKQLEGIKKANECGLATRGEFNKDIEAIETVLNLLEKKDREIEKLKQSKIRQLERYKKYKENIDNQHEKIYEDLVEEIEFKDKIIDLMSYAMTHEEVPQDEYCIIRTMACEVMGGNRACKDCIKQYFEKKVEGE